MSITIKNVLDPYFKQLNAIRHEAILWNEYACLDTNDDENFYVDANARKRLYLLITIFYDFQPKDELLLRFLLKQETHMHQKLTSQGSHFSLELCTALLARLKNPENISLFIAAKTANFDTYSGGIEEIVLLSAGLDKTYRHIFILSKSDKEFFIDRFGTNSSSCEYTDDDINIWINETFSILPKSLDNLSIEQEIDLAVLLDNREIIDRTVGEWMNTVQIWDEGAYRTLARYESYRKNHSGQIIAQEHLLPFIPDVNKSVYCQLISNLYLKIKDIEKAWEYFVLSTKYYAENNTSMIWGACGMFLELCMDIIITQNDRHAHISQNAHEWAKNYLLYEKWTWGTIIINKIISASIIMEDTQLLELYTKKLADIQNNTEE